VPAAVCFDNDGLLLETEGAWSRAEVVLFRRYGAEFTDEHKRYLMGSAAEVANRKLEEMLELPGRGEALGEELHVLVMEEVARGVEPMPGAVDLLDALRAAGTPIALVSNSAREFVELTLQTAGVRDRLDVVLAREDAANSKPAPDLYLAACAALGVDPADAVGLEDTATGIAALKAAGLFAIGVPSFPGMALDQADLVVGSLADPAVHRALGL
jgi:HAD superfamily hydrolase (TIGR01509 family)